jgi:glutathione S-transferase
MGEALLVIEGHIKGPFLLGENMSLADIYIAMFFIWHRGEIDTPRLFALTNKVRSDRAIGPIWRRHFGKR